MFRCIDLMPALVVFLFIPRRYVGILMIDEQTNSFLILLLSNIYSNSRGIMPIPLIYINKLRLYFSQFGFLLPLLSIEGKQSLRVSVRESILHYIPSPNIIA